MNPGIYIGIPTYDGKLQYQTVAGLVETARFCGEKHLSICVDIVAGDAFIGKARDTLVNRFLKNTDWEDFVFVDADVGFSLEGLKALMRCPEDIVGGLYRCKSEKVQFPGLMWNPCVVNPRDPALVKMQYLPTGFMRIKRRVFEKLRELTPDACYFFGGADGGEQHEFFPHGRTGHQFHGEDISFSMAAIAAGFDIWGVQDIELSHTGPKQYDAAWRVLRAVDEEKAA